MVEDKIENMVIEGDVSKELQVRIKKLKKQEEIRERKTNNIVIKKGSSKKRLIRNSSRGNASERTPCRSASDGSILDKKRDKYGNSKAER